jgi:hypothetical protein
LYNTVPQIAVSINFLCGPFCALSICILKPSELHRS